MRLIIREKKIAEAKFAGSRGNVTETVTNALIRSIAKFYAEKALNPQAGGTFFIDVSKEMEALQKKAPARTVIVKDKDGNEKEKHIPSKYDLNIKSILWKVPQIGFGLNDPAHYLNGIGQIKLNINLPYSTLEYEIYLDSLKKKQPDIESFNKSLYESLSEVMSKKSSYLRKRPEQWDLESLKKIAKEERKNIPEFTTSNFANKYNLKTKNINSPFPPITQKQVNEAIEKIKPNPAKMSKIYDIFKKKENKDSLEESVLSAAYHEVTHGRQYSGGKETTEDGMTISGRIKNMAKLFNEENFLLLPTYVYTGNFRDTRDDVVDKFHYFSRPIEIDARAEEYRKNLTDLKKTNPSTAGEKLFNFILKQEIHWAENGIPKVKVSRSAPDFIKNEDLIKDEVKYKCLAQVFEQIAYHIKDISDTDPRYKEKADEYAQKVRDINEKIKSALASTIRYFDPKERLRKTITAGYA